MSAFQVRGDDPQRSLAAGGAAGAGDWRLLLLLEQGVPWSPEYAPQGREPAAPIDSGRLGSVRPRAQRPLRARGRPVGRA